MIDLPAEIWRSIAHYLPTSTLLGLYGVNGFFFDLAMNERYRDVRFDERTKSPSHLLDRLQEPSIARRVRQVTFDPGFMYQPPQKEKETYNVQKHSKLTKLIHSVARRKEGDADKKSRIEVLPASSEIEDGLRACIPFMTNVRDFRLAWVSQENLSRTHLDTWLSSVADNLVELRLLVSTTTADRLFLLSPYFPRLQRCSITILHRPSDEDSFPLETNLASFLNSLKDTLQHLVLNYRPTRNSVLFDHLDTFKSLSSLEIDVSIRDLLDKDIPTPAMVFIQRNAVTLRDLCIRTSIIGAANTFQFTFDDLQLLNLRSLSMTAGVMAFSWEASCGFLETHASNLKSLTILGPIAPAEVTKLLTSINHRNSYCALSVLSISIYQLDIRVLATLAEALTRLQSFKLLIHKISSQAKYSIVPSEFFPVEGRSPEEKVYPFVDELRSCDVLKHWNLRDITIERISCCAPLTLWGLMRLCAKCIPAITSFSGNGDMIIPKPSNTPPSAEVPCSAANRSNCYFGIDGVLF